MEFLRFLLLILIAIIFSGITSFIFFNWAMNDVEDNSSCGTGSIGDAFGVLVVSFIIFLIGLGVYGSILYWIIM